LVVERRAVDWRTDACASGIAGVRSGAKIAVIAGHSRLGNGHTGSGVAGADIALVGQRSAFGIEAAVGVDEVAMVGDMLVQRVRTDGDDVVRIRRRAGEMANGDFICRRR
jgi:hypothetical protein